MTKEPLVLKFGYGKLRVQMCSVPAGHEPLHHSPVSVGVAIFTERDENTPACVLTFVDMHQASLVTEALAGRVSIPRSDLRQLLDMSGPTSFQPADVSLGALRNGLSVLIPQPVDLVEGAQDTIRALNTDIATFKEALEKSNIVADGLQTQWQDAVSAYDELRDDVAEMCRQLSNNEWTGGIYCHAGATSLASEIRTLTGRYHEAKAGQQEWVCKDCNTIQPAPNCRTTDTRCPTVGCYGTLVPSSLNERLLETKVDSLEEHIKALPLEGTLSATLPPAEHSNSGVTRLYKCCNCGHTKWMRRTWSMDVKCPVPDCHGTLVRAVDDGQRRHSAFSTLRKPYITSSPSSHVPVQADHLPQWFGAKLGKTYEEDEGPKCAKSKVQQRDRYKVLTTKIGEHEYSFNIDYVPQEQHAWLEGTLSSVFSRVVDDARNDTLRSLRKKLGVLKDLLK